jgi:DNA-binding transcriptional LysR family regulator
MALDDSAFLARVLGRLRFRHLHLLEIAARTGNLHRAAEEMHLTQPATSKILQDLEDILEVELFDRSRRGIVLTEIGRAAAVKAERILGDGLRLAREVALLKRGGFGTISIGAIMAIASDLLPRTISELKRRRPYLTIHLTAATSDVLLQALGRGDLEVVIGRLTETNQALMFETEPLGNEELWMFTSPEAVDWTTDTPTLVDLMDRAWVLQPPTSPMRQALDRVFADAGCGTPLNIVETTSIFATLRLVRHSGMTAILPRTIVEPEILKGEFVRVPIELIHPLSEYCLVLRRGEPRSPDVEELVTVLREQMILAGTPTAGDELR